MHIRGSLKKLNVQRQQKSDENETHIQPFLLYYVMASVLRVHPESSSLFSNATSRTPNTLLSGGNERSFKVGWFLALDPSSGVPIALSRLGVVVVAFAFLAPQTKARPATVLVQQKEECDRPA